MKYLILGIILGLTCTTTCIAKDFIKSSPMTIVLTERNFVNTTLVKTEEGTYRIFTLESQNGSGITAVKIK